MHRSYGIVIKNIETMIQEKLYLTEFQSIFYYEWKKNPERSDYNMIVEWLIEGNLDVERLNTALIRFVNDHLLMHCNVSSSLDNDVPYWTERSPINEQERIINYIDYPLSAKEINSILRAEINLEEDLLVCYILIKEADRKYRLFMVHAHIISDGLSADEFFDLYCKYYKNTNYSSNIPLKEQYDLHLNLNAKLHNIKNENIELIRNFWEKSLNGLSSIDLSFLYNTRKRKPDFHNEDIKEFYFDHSEHKTLGIRKLTKVYGITPYIFGQMVFAILINRITKNKLFGYSFPVAILEGREMIYGAHVNTLVIRFDFEKSNSLKDLIDNMKSYYNELKKTKAKYLPITNIVNSNNSGILDVAFIQTSLREAPVELGEDIEVFTNNKNHIDLVNAIVFEQEQMRGTIRYRVRYDGSILDEILVGNFIRLYRKFSDQILDDLLCGYHNKHIADYRLDENSIDNFNKDQSELYHTSYNYPDNIKTIFEKTTITHKQNDALYFNGNRITYRELNIRANKLADYLISEHSIKPNDYVVLCLDRSDYMVVGILAVIKAGGAYVPVDPLYPSDRIGYVCDDTKAKVILTNQCHKEKMSAIVQDKDICVAYINNPHFEEETLRYCNPEDPEVLIKPEDAAYVIYTSGTTGKPKGVIVEHGNVTRLFSATKPWFGFNDSDVWTLFHSYTFDFSVWEIWGALLYGGKLIIPTKEETRDLDMFYNLCLSEGVTVLNQTPNAFYQFIDVAISKDEHLNNLRYVIFGGEALNLTQLKAWFNVYEEGAPSLINMYGITETTVHVTYKEIRKSELDCGSLIGVPIPDETIYVLDEDRLLLPVGALGELYVGGAGVARGYLNRPELTSERFIPNPYQREEEKRLNINTRLYKSGDLVRLLPDGSLEYMGRNDFQVKIRGFRIELGEIESQMSSYPGIRQSAVFAKEHVSGASKYLAAYYVSDEEVNEEDLTEHLKNYLPEYMIPSVFIHMTEFPLTLNGKLDSKSLPEPEFVNADNYIAPENDVEKILCEIYSDVLGLDRSAVGTADDFFKLGGDSISSIRLVNQIRQRLGIKITVKEIFSNRTIESLYLNVILNLETGQSTINAEQGLLAGQSGLLPIQEWFFMNVNNSLFEDENHYNQSFALKVPLLDKDLLARSVAQLTAHHDALRFRYNRHSLNTEQCYSESIPDDILGYYTKAELSQAEINEWQKGFDLYSGKPLFRICYVDGYGNNEARLLFFFHHLIIDGVSWRIIKDDLYAIYKSISENEDGKLSAKTSSYRQWVRAVNENYNGDSEIKHWENIRSSIKKSNEKLLSLCCGGNNTTHISFSEDETGLLLREINSKFSTNINDILLSALTLSLYKLTGLKENHVLLEGHGREDVFSNLDVTNTVGWFTSMYPATLHIQNENIRDVVVNIKDSLRKIPNNGFGYGPLYGYSSDELPYLTFNYLGQFDSNEAEGQEKWSFAQMDMGKSFSDRNRDKSVISFNGGLFDGVLQFYISSVLDSKAHSEFVEYYKYTLRFIIDYLSKENRSYLTPSDTGNIISVDYLNEIQLDKEVEHVYLANSLQQGFIYHSLNLGAVDDAYHVQLIWNYFNSLDLPKLKEAWMYAQKKFSALRLRFSWKEELVQIIDRVGTVDWDYRDLRELKTEERSSFISELISNDRNRPFDLSEGNLFRIYMIKLGEEEYRCIFSSHHAIMDGWSMPVLIKYIHDTYANLVHGQPVDVSADIAYTEAQHYLQENRQLNADFWKSYVGKVDFQEDLSSLLMPVSRNIVLGEYKHIKEPKELELHVIGKQYTGLKALCNEKGFTVNAVLQYCWHKLLSIYGACDTTIVGTTVAGRNLPINNIERSVGLYINTLPVIFEHRSAKVVELILELQENINEVNSRSDASLADLQSGGNRLFNSLFVFENYPVDEQDSNSELRLKIEESIEKVDYPLGVTAFEQGDQLVIKLQYAGEIFDERIINGLVDGIELLLNQLIDRSSIGSDELVYVTPDDYKKLVYDWNDTYVEYPSHKTLHGLFEEQVEKTPDSIALTYKEINLTYKELNEKANQLANYLRSNYEIKPDDLIVLCLDRSEKMLIGILAALKSGAAYVPIDFSYPDDRISFIVSDTDAKVLLTEEQYASRLDELLSDTVGIEAIDKNAVVEKAGDYPVGNPESATSGSNLAYIIYTSGTTGQPKGVMVEHRSVVNLMLSLPSRYQMGKNEIILFFANYVFDTSVEQIFLSLTRGYRLLMVFKELWENCSSFLDALETEGVTHVDLTPSFLGQFEIESIKSIRRVISGGEAINELLFTRLQKAHFMFYNSYGLSETSVTSTIGDSNFGVNIGKPIDNTTIYVLDDNRSILPIGAIGELYIGGEGVARGYLKNESMTNLRFVNNPFKTDVQITNNYNSVLYRTGDIVRFNDNGVLEYIGRNDLQVKIRGFRVELGEIEAKMLTIPQIKQAVVIVRNNQLSPYLVAYYVSDLEYSKNQMEKYLKKELPDYMLPKFYLKMNSIPLTINGKVSIKELPEINIECNDDYKAPTTQNEKTITTILSELLGIDYYEVSVDDNFFSLGGNSILAIRFISRINSAFDVKLKISDLHNFSSISELAESIESTSFNLIVSFNNSGKQSKDIVMIHPGGAGCEVYNALCGNLKHRYNCLGVDSYNLYNENKINILNDLASYYLSSLNGSVVSEKEYRFLGWSLGGLIAMEMAYILEEKGYKDIHIYLLDTIVYDSVLTKYFSDENKTLASQYLDHFSIYGIDDEEIKRFLEVEGDVSSQQVSGKLKHTKVTLFKAKCSDSSISDEINSYIKSLKYNNVDKYVSMDNITLITLENCCHSDILTNQKVISDNISD